MIEEWEIQNSPNEDSDADYHSFKKISLINRIKRDFSGFFHAYDKQIRKDMGFWIKYRPSRWGDLLPSKFIIPLRKFIRRKGGKKFVLKLVLIFSLLLIGFIPTLDFIWSHIFRVGLFFLVIPLVYWTFVIAFVYARVIFLACCKFLRVIFDNLIER